jgi:ubiquinone/menaquinone biosynthesis C-methylase UbiE
MKVKELYEEFPFPLRGNHDSFMEKYIFPSVPGQPRRIMDAGCGTGNMTIELARRFPDAEIVGIDFSENSLTRAKMLAQDLNIKNVEFRYHDLTEGFPFEERERMYNFVVCIGCLHHTPDPRLCLRQLRTILAKDGLLMVVVYGKYGRVETEIRRKFISLLRQITGKSNSELLYLCKQTITEPFLNLNSYSKPRLSLGWALYMAWQNPSLFATVAARAVLSKVGIRSFSCSAPCESGMADQYLHPLVHDWTAGQWVEAIESVGFKVDGFIYDYWLNGWCIPRDPLSKIENCEIRALLTEMTASERYEALDLIFRPSMHVIACKPV